MDKFVYITFQQLGLIITTKFCIVVCLIGKSKGTEINLKQRIKCSFPCNQHVTT